jgi:hypothetical protein
MTDEIKVRKPRKKKTPLVIEVIPTKEVNNPLSKLEQEQPAPVVMEPTVTVLKSVFAYLNHGRWLVICPVCKNQTQVQIGMTLFVCSACHPATIATAKILVHTRTRAGLEQSLFREVADLAIREEALDIALAAGEQYFVEFPSNAEEIMSVLRPLDVTHINWAPSDPDIMKSHPEMIFDQTVADLKAEILAHGG